MRKWFNKRRVGWFIIAAVALTLGIVLSLLVLGGTERDFTATPYADVIRFEAEGVASLQVRIFDLSGRELWGSGVVSSQVVDWDRRNDFGERLAYGAYLYQAQGWHIDGNEVLSKQGKLALLPGDKVELQAAPPMGPVTQLGPAPPSSGESPYAPKAYNATSFYVSNELGVGTDNPQRKVHVAGSTPIIRWDASDGISYAEFQYLSAHTPDSMVLVGRKYSGGTNPDMGFGGINGNKIWVKPDGKVGIGTINPQRQLHVAGTIPIIRWDAKDGISYAEFQYISADSPDSMVLVGRKYAGGTYPDMGFGGPIGDKIWVKPDGRVGIGTTNPTATLEVHGSASNLLALYDPALPGDAKFRVEKDGDVYADGTYYSSDGQVHVGSADVAERINTSEWVEPGNVVEIDPEHPGFFRKSQSPYSTKVAGIVSASPGVVLGNSFDASADKWEDNRPLLAIAGRVPLKVTTENGAIQIGDLLVSSSTPGYAMRCSDRATCVGATIGKALEPLEEGTGVIMVQVTLR